MELQGNSSKTQCWSLSFNEKEQGRVIRLILIWVKTLFQIEMLVVSLFPQKMETE